MPQAPQYQSAIRDAAAQYKVSEQTLIRLLSAESGFNPNAVSPAGARGIAQFMPETAQSLGVNPDDPISSIFGAAKYLNQLGKMYGWEEAQGELTGMPLELAVASYVSGPGTVKKAAQAAFKGLDPFSYKSEEDLNAALMDKFRNLWPTMTNDPEGVRNYLSSITGPPTSSEYAASTTTSRTTSTRGFVQPTLEDFKVYEQDQATGQQKWTGEYDVQAFNRAMAEFRASESSDDDFAKYLDTVINAASTEIQMGNANVSKARQEFDRQMQAHEVAGNQFAQLLGYAIPAGASYVPGREPGGFYEKMGLSPRQASGQYFDPFAEAFKIVQRTPDLTTINTNPTGAMLPAAVSAARSLAGGGSGSTSTGLATGAPPLPTTPNPPPAPTEAQRIAQEFMMNQSRQPNYASNLAAQYDGA